MYRRLNLSQFGTQGVRLMSSLYRILHELVPVKTCYRCKWNYYRNGRHWCKVPNHKGDPRLPICDSGNYKVEFVDEKK